MIIIDLLYILVRLSSLENRDLPLAHREKNI